MQTTITLVGRVPSKKNSKQIVCRGSRPRAFPSEKYLAWHVDASWQLKLHRVKKIPKCTHIQISFFPPDRIAGDLTNKAESIMDLLVENGILVDDNWFEVPSTTFLFGGVDKNNPRAEIVIHS